MSFFKLASSSRIATPAPSEPRRAAPQKFTKSTKAKTSSRAGGFSLNPGLAFATADAPDEAQFAKF
jgi:methyl-accepting chemotaxis protein